MKNKSIILDCDGVICDFISGIISIANERGMRHLFPSSPSDVAQWNICDKFLELFNEVKYEDEFWLELPVLNFIDFTPTAYLTARPCKSEVTALWLERNGFPEAEVITVKDPLDKIEVLKTLNPLFFVDDHLWTVAKARENGINAILFNQPYQRGHEEEIKEYNLPRIYSLGELEEICSK